MVNGGEDAALATALALLEQPQPDRHVTLLHRRDGFKADEALVAAFRTRLADGGLHLVVGQPTALDSQALHITNPQGETVTLPADAVLACLGLSPRLGPLADWGLAMERKQLPVDSEKFETCERGVFAVGDINTYPGKKKLILCGFHEATLAAWAATAIVFPGKSVPLQYTTTSSRLHTLLGVRP